MLPRYLSQSARAFAAHATEARIPQASRRTFLHAQESHAPLRSSIASSRWYSASAAEPAKDEAKAEEAKPEAEKEDPVKKELEAKKKELVDITVRGRP